ncbi:MAG: hypothetical protein WBE97_11670, partial [Candidatus Acidiferrales bacterium]
KGHAKRFCVAIWNQDQAGFGERSIFSQTRVAEDRKAAGDSCNSAAAARIELAADAEKAARLREYLANTIGRQQAEDRIFDRNFIKAPRDCVFCFGRATAEEDQPKASTPIERRTAGSGNVCQFFCENRGRTEAKNCDSGYVIRASRRIRDAFGNVGADGDEDRFVLCAGDCVTFREPRNRRKGIGEDRHLRAAVQAADHPILASPSEAGDKS